MPVYCHCYIQQYQTSPVPVSFKHSLCGVHYV